MVSYIQKIEEIDSQRTIPVIANDLRIATEVQLDNDENRLEMGWANKPIRNRKVFSDDVLKFLNDKFDEGLTSGKKLDPKDVEKLMKNEKLDNKKRFPINDRLTARQIASYFSRKASKKRLSSAQQSSAHISSNSMEIIQVIVCKRLL